MHEFKLIETPGKFEGEPTFIPHFWELTLENGEDGVVWEFDTPFSIFILTDEDKIKFPELIPFCKLAVWESDQGFVNSEFFKTEEEYQTWLMDTESDSESCDSCDALMIMGTYCHETGCPNQNKFKENGVWVTE